MTISVRNLDAALGAEIGGIDLSKPVAQDDVQAIENASRSAISATAKPFGTPT